MWRYFKIVLLSVGVVAGYGFAVHAARHGYGYGYGHGYGYHDREGFERHVAQICVDAARGANVEH
jgi:hypothetical protein